AFIRKPRRGLHHIEIFATDEQYETLITTMNTATNPRLTPHNNPNTTNSAGTTAIPSTTTTASLPSAAGSGWGATASPSNSTTTDGVPAPDRDQPGNTATTSAVSAATSVSNTSTVSAVGVSGSSTPGPELDRRSRAQKLLDGLITGCNYALRTG
ncbi:hypothetical protein ACKLTP_18635, partial [Paenarthrobacter ureafaciens]